MTFTLIVSQGRVADRTSGTLVGADLTAHAFERRFNSEAIRVGKPTPPARDNWRISLPQADETLRALQQRLETAIDDKRVPVLVANTCSASLASLPVVARHYPDAVVLWIDAHGDFNTPATSESGYLGGMVVAAACGLWDSGHGAGLSPKNVILVGARDIDPPEQALLEQAGVRIIPPTHATPDALLAAIGNAPVWIHVDWDVLEPGYVPADYHVAEGLLPAQLHALFAAMPPEKILGFEVAEFNAPDQIDEVNLALTIIVDIFTSLFDAVIARPVQEKSTGSGQD